MLRVIAPYLITLPLLPVIIYLCVLLGLLIILVYIKLMLEPVRRVCTSNVRLDGKVALVTGGNQSIGLETARDLAARGARVVIACRDAKRAAEAIADIVATTGNVHVEYRPLDLAKFSSVRKFAEDFKNSYDRLDILVHNAGCISDPKPTEDGNEMVMQVNYLGPFLLTKLLLEKVIASKPSRIVIVSSWLQHFSILRVNDLNKSSCLPFGFGMLVNYGNSKLCHILWMKALAKRLPEGVTVNALHPGVIKTDIFSAMPLYLKKPFYWIADTLLFRTAKEGAQTTIHLCVAEEVEGVRGKYFMECNEAYYNWAADDDDLVEQVWEKSVKMTSSIRCLQHLK